MEDKHSLDVRKMVGKLVGIRGQVAEVEFDDQNPDLFDVLLSGENPDIRLEVVSSSGGASKQSNSLGGGRFYCLVLSGEGDLYRGMELYNSEDKMKIPVGDGLLGRAFDIFGRQHDERGELDKSEMRNLFGNNKPEWHELRISEKVLETGIKVIDFFTPILRGGKVGLFGGAGVGKTMLLTELLNNLLIKRLGDKKENVLTSQMTENEQIKPILGNETVGVFSAVGERSREAQELYNRLEETGVLQKMILLLGQMGENPAVRFRTAYAGATLASFFRDELNKDVLFLIDNVYRFAQAGQELSTMMGLIPSEDGYQPTLNSEMGDFHERLVSKMSGLMTVIEAIFVPADDTADYAVRSVFPFLDTFIVLSRNVYQEGRLPAVDLLTSNSRALNSQIVGDDHYLAYLEAKNLLQSAANLDKIVSLVGFSELSYEDQILHKRALLLKNYMTQSFFTASSQTGKEGSFVPLEQVVADVKRILVGELDNVDPEKLSYIGVLEGIV